MTLPTVAAVLWSGRLKRGNLSRNPWRGSCSLCLTNTNNMTIVYKREEFEAGSGLMLYIEQYAEKPHFVKFWRYGPIGGVWSDMLMTKPRKKRLIETC